MAGNILGALGGERMTDGLMSPLGQLGLQLMANHGTPKTQGMFAGAPEAIQRAFEYKKEKDARLKEETQTRKTYDFFRQTAPEYADAIDAGLPTAQAWGAYLQDRKGAKGGDPESFYGNTIPIEDAEGNIQMGQVGNRGTFRPLDIGKGNKFASPTKTEDIGTHIITYDRYGNELYRTEKENYQESHDKGRGAAEGKAEAETKAEYDSISSKMPGLERVIADLDDLSEKATYTQGGQLLDSGMRQTGMEPREAAVARADYIAKVDNQVLPLLRDTFGAAFTQKEGDTLRQTLGDPDKSPKEKQAVLKAFIEQKRRDVEALGSRTGATRPITAPASSGGDDPLEIR